jgi:ElaB/YqjD/DUF883 family membrane-anchored ribosome-binding protein
VAERAEELRDQLDAQRAGISRTVEQIENRVTPGRVLSRRRYRMRRSVVDWKDRLMGNDEPDYPAHWYAQPAAPLGPEYAYSEHGYRGTRYTFDEADYHDEGGRMSEVKDRAQGTMQQARGQASGMAHEASERASGMAHEASERASGMAHDLSDRVQHAPETVRRQTQGNPIALGIMAFGAGLLAGTLLPESRRERDLARRAEPHMQRAVEEGRHAAEEVVMDLREPAEESMEQVKETAATEAQAFKAEATEEAKRTRSDVESAARE